MPSDSEVRVLYVGGTGRSGSTVLANALGALDGAVSVGEVRYLWERGIIENRLCGCGARFADCPFWQQVLDTAYGPAIPNAREVHRRLTEETRLRTLPGFLRTRAGGASAPADLADVLHPLYAAIAAVSGARLVVDSSKLPTYAGVLAGVRGLRLDVVHLVRDPRAAAFSWKRVKEQPDRGRPGVMEQRGAVKSAILWTAWNAGLERAWRGSPTYSRVRYETFAAHPYETIALLGEAIGCAGAERVVDDEGRLHLPPNHTVAGNPARMSAGPTPVRLDNEWATAMNQRDLRVVSGLTAPLLGRYGYPRSVGAEQED